MSNNTELAQTAVRIRESYGTLIARHFPTAADIDNKWIFSEDVSMVINVSQHFDQDIATAIRAKGIKYHHLPLDEEVRDIGWENIQQAVELISRYEQIGKKIIIHCDFGQHRSRLVVEAFHYAKYGEHLIDPYKGYDNRLKYNSAQGYLPNITQIESILSRL